MIAHASYLHGTFEETQVDRAFDGVDDRELLPWADPYIAQLVRNHQREQAFLAAPASSGEESALPPGCRRQTARAILNVA